MGKESPQAEELAMLRRLQECRREGVNKGSKAAATAGIATAVPLLAAVYTIPWAKANLNYPAQALIVSTAAVAAYLLGASQGSLECAERIVNSRKAP